MPNALPEKVRGHRLFFYSDERHEPPHVHVEHGDNTAKVWLEDPPRVAFARGFSGPEVRRLLAIISERRDALLSAWKEHFRNG